MSLRDWFAIDATATPATVATPTVPRHPPVASVATVAVATRETSDIPSDPGYVRRRAKALALLDEEPSRRMAVVAEAPKAGEAVGHVCTAVRHVAVADITIPAE